MGPSGLHELPGSVQILHLRPVELAGAQCADWSSAPSSSTSPLWTRACNHLSRRRKTMLWTICVVLLVLWALGMATSYTAGGLIHVLLVIGLIVLVFRLIQGRRVLG
jgi:hypothetical protein